MRNVPLVSVVKTGVANIASVKSALKRCGAEPRLIDSSDEISEAELLVLPGVGAFGAGIDKLQSRELCQALRERVMLGRPTLAICLGMQLLAGESEEAPGVLGLEVFSSKLKRFSTSFPVPHLGWNWVEPKASSYLEPGYAYFAHSYCFSEAPTNWQSSVTDYDGKFVAALERGRVLACQFHPELSGDWGEDLLRRWIFAEERENANY